MSIIDKTLQNIKEIVKDYHDWTIGQTMDPQESQQMNGAPKEWHCWDVENHLAAHVIGTYLIARGMKIDSAQDGTFVYIFKTARKQESDCPRNELCCCSSISGRTASGSVCP